MSGKGAGVRGSGAMLGKGVRADVSEQVTSQQRPKGGEGCLEEELSKQGNCRCKGPEGERAICSEGERLVGSQ